MASLKKDKNQYIQVFVRIRPLNKQEGPFNCIEISSPKQLTIRYHGTDKAFNYDRVFGPETKQNEIYKLVAATTVKEVIAGYNCTILAYGQTGTGKTYTMVGEIIPSSTQLENVHAGIIPRTIAQLFDELQIQQLEYTIRVSYLELYNEEIFDLLSPVEANSKLKLYDDNMKKGSVIVHGLTEVTVNTKSEVFKILEKGAEKRRIATTLMNAQSSRSHTVFCITVHIKETTINGDELLKIGKLYLVDLAGSENIKQSGAKEIRAREASNINQSLLTLGRCIAKLVERSGHIPYRESKLTRLLQDSLEGGTKTTLIATVSPAPSHSDESINTLDYAFRAKNITNKPVINQRLTKKTLIKEYTKEIERLKRDLIASKMGTGVFLDEENYDSLMRDRTLYKEEISAKLIMIRILEAEMANKERLCEQLKFKMEQHKKEVELKTGNICTLESKLEISAQEIFNLQQKNHISEYFIKKYSETEEQLKSTAKELIQVADITTANTSKLHDKLEVFSDINVQNKQIYEQHFTELNAKFDCIHNKLRIFHDQVYSFHKHFFNLMTDIQRNFDISKQKSNEIEYAITTTKSYIHNLEFEINNNMKMMENNYKVDQCNILGNLDKIKEVIKNKIDCNIIPKMEECFQFVDEQNNHMFTVLNEIFVTLNKFEVNLKSFLDDHKEISTKTKKQQCKHVEQAINFTNGIQNVLNRETETQCSKTAIEKEYANVMTSLSNLKMLIDKRRTKMNSNTAETIQEVKSLQNHLSLCEKTHQSSDKTSDIVNNLNQQIIGLNEQTRKEFNRLQEKYLNCFENISHSKYDINNAVAELKEINKEFYQQDVDIFQKELKSQRDITIDQSTNYLSVIKNLKDNLDYTQKYGEDLNSLEEAIITKLNTVQNQIQLNELRCAEMECAVHSVLDNCHQSFHKMHSSRKEYKITGETPQRTFYRYPRTLVETKPKDELLKSFYSTDSGDKIKEKKE